MKKIYILLTISLAINSVFAQNDPDPDVSQDNQDAIERVMQDGNTDGGSIADNTAFEALDNLTKHRININKAEEIDFKLLTETLLLTDFQVQSLFAYRKKYGDLLALEELQAVPNWDLDAIRRVLPFLKVDGGVDDFHVSLKDLFTKGTNEFYLRGGRFVEKTKGYYPNATTGQLQYLGNPWKVYSRFKHSYENKLSIGITAEKDPGEQFLNGTNPYGFDFYSAHLFLNNYSKTVKAVAIGDYELRLGQGLTQWAGLAYGKTADACNIKKSARTLKQFSSVNEATYMRGAAATLQFGKFDVTVFGSYRNRDGNIPTDSAAITDNEIPATALGLSGLHRTTAEIFDRNTLQQLTTGGAVSYKGNGFKIGVNGVYNHLSRPILPTFQPYNQFKFKGDRLFNGSVDYSYLWQNFNFFGETAMSDNGGIATVNGVIIGLDRKISLAVQHRHYSRNYQVLQGAGFGEYAGTNNETGLYVGMQIRPRREWLLAGYFDAFESPWLRYGVDAPSRGYEYLLQINHRPSRGTDIYVRFKDQFKPENNPTYVQGNGINLADLNVVNPKIHYLIDTRRTSFRFHVTNKISKTLELRTRFDGVLFSKTDAPNNLTTTAQGFLLYQDVAWKSAKLPLQLTGRFAIFNTDNYDTGLYAYENDILYSYSTGHYYYKGARFYTNIRYRPLKWLTMELHAGQTYIDNKATTGSGLDEFPSNFKTDIRGQLRFSF